MSSVWVIFIPALVLRLGYLAVFAPPFASEYWELSSSILRNGSMMVTGSPSTDFEPFYPFFLAITRLLTGDHHAGSQVLQAVAASGGVVFVHRLALALTNQPRVGAIAAALFACHPLLVRQASIASDLSLATTLVAAFAWLFVRASSVRSMALAGCVLGLTLLTRSVALPLLVFAPLALVAQRRAREAVILVLAAAVLFVPYVVRNRLVSGSATPTRSGLNLYIGNSPYTASLLPEHDLDLLEEHAYLAVQQTNPAFDPALGWENDAINTILATRAWEYLKEDPLRTAGLIAQKAVYVFWPVVSPYYVTTQDTRAVFDEDGQIVVRDARPRPAFEVYSYSAFSFPVLAAAIAGLYLRRRLWEQDAILWCIVATFAGVHAVYFPATRYSAPMACALLFYAAVGLDRAIATASR